MKNLYQNKDFIIYNLEKDKILLYNKQTKQSFILDDIQKLDSLEEKMRLDANYLKQKSPKFYGVSFYNIDSYLNKLKFKRIIAGLLIYGSIPTYIFGLFLNLSIIKKYLITPIEINDFNIVYQLLLIVPILIFSLIVHELGHAIIAISKGAFVPEIGIGFKEKKFYAYTKILQLEKIQSLKDRIYVCCAGIFANMILAAICLLWNAFFENNLLETISFINFFIILFNFSIYYNSDGADILKNLLKANENQEPKKEIKKVVIFSAALFNLILPISILISLFI